MYINRTPSLTCLKLTTLQPHITLLSSNSQCLTILTPLEQAVHFDFPFAHIIERLWTWILWLKGDQHSSSILSGFYPYMICSSKSRIWTSLQMNLCILCILTRKTFNVLVCLYAGSAGSSSVLWSPQLGVPSQHVHRSYVCAESFGEPAVFGWRHQYWWCHSVCHQQCLRWRWRCSHRCKYGDLVHQLKELIFLKLGQYHSLCQGYQFLQNGSGFIRWSTVKQKPFSNCVVYTW